VAVLQRFLKAVWLPLIDFAAVSTALFTLDFAYQEYTGILHEKELITAAFFIISGLFPIILYLSGGYDRPIKLRNLIKGGFIHIGIVLLAYSLLPEHLRFSRFVTVFGTLAGTGFAVALRLILNRLQVSGAELQRTDSKRIGLVGTPVELTRIRELLNTTGIDSEVIIDIYPNDNTPNETDGFVGRIGQLPEIIKAFSLNEIIFSAAGVSSDRIMRYMAELRVPDLEFKIAPPESPFIIGSNSINASGSFYSLTSLNSISTAANVRNKRLLDILHALLFLGTLPIGLILNPTWRFPLNCLRVLTGYQSWVGYTPTIPQEIILPTIKKGILYSSDYSLKKNLSAIEVQKANINYANKYKPDLDVSIIWKNLNQLGR
jgi:hypothetical protein